MRRKVIWLKHLNKHETQESDEDKNDDILIEHFKRPSKVVPIRMKQDPDFYPSTS